MKFILLLWGSRRADASPRVGATYFIAALTFWGTGALTTARRHNFGPMEVLSNVLQSNLAVSTMPHLSVWVAEFIKLLVGRRLHPLLTQCPICRQKVHLHVNRAGRRHVFSHARGLYEGCQLCKHSVGKIKCLGSGALMIFDPRPNERQRFKLPDSLLEK
jgi:hypothetical protein